MTEQEQYQAFERLAFYYENGKPRRVLEVKPNGLVWCRIAGHHNYKHEWWKDCIGLIIEAEPKFHISPHKWQFLYEIIPIIEKYNRYKDKVTILQGQSIIASCIRIIDHSASNKNSNKQGKNNIIL